MTSRPLDFDRFAKLIALAHSANPGEAGAALRAGRKMLAEAGLCFRDFAEMVQGSVASSAIGTVHLELRLKGLSKRLRDREAEIAKLRAELATWRDLA
ncbi:MAG: hypothetical protein QNJ92_01305 [Alphaproteobacteria bacterium]|nr:hypothetical protein [Alphaproteobacteria bacterium]